MMIIVKGVFITLEGVDGSGKTTMLNHIAQTLTKQGFKIHVTKEPGGTDVALKIREIIVNEDVLNEPIDRTAQLLLFYAARIQHIKNVIIPMLNNGVIVLSDRYIDSTIVYQGLLNGLQSTINDLMSIDSLSYLKQRPDHTLFYEVSTEVSIDRTTNRGEMNSLDVEYLSKKELPINLFEKHMCNVKYLKNEDSELHLLNANESIENVKLQTDKVLEHILNKEHVNRFIDRIVR